MALAGSGMTVFPALTAVAHAHPPQELTAQDVVDRIKKATGGTWEAGTVDTFKAGDPATPVTGIAAVSLATLTALRQAAGSGSNLVITCEPTFYSRADTSTPSAGRGGAPPSPDPVLQAKINFIKDNRLVIWRFSDHWRQRMPDPLSMGLTDALGWAKFRATGDPSRVTIAATSLESLAAEIRQMLNARGGIRVVGDPRLMVQTIGLLPGTTSIQAALKMLPEVDAIVAGEVREWESVEYVRDKVTAGERKSLILLGRVVSEDHGMNVCAQWLKTVVPEIPTTWIPVPDPYWRPA